MQPIKAISLSHMDLDASIPLREPDFNHPGIVFRTDCPLPDDSTILYQTLEGKVQAEKVNTEKGGLIKISIFPGFLTKMLKD